MATGSPDKKQTKRSMIHIVPASSSYRRFVSRRKISMMIPLALFSRAVFLFFMPFSSWCISSGSMDLSLRIHDIEVVAEFPHDPQAFTQRQGLLYAGNDTLYKSTGLYGKVEFLEKMGDSYFGEGLTLLGERLFQVAWLTNTGFSYDLHNLREVKPFKHQMKDGWGLATDGEVLFGSDGTSTLYRMDPHTMKIRYNGREVRYLNALEYINKEVWANVWQVLIMEMNL